jgi:hypothetical protein
MWTDVFVPEAWSIEMPAVDVSYVSGMREGLTILESFVG